MKTVILLSIIICYYIYNYYYQLFYCYTKINRGFKKVSAKRTPDARTKQQLNKLRLENIEER